MGIARRVRLRVRTRVCVSALDVVPVSKQSAEQTVGIAVNVDGGTRCARRRHPPIAAPPTPPPPHRDMKYRDGSWRALGRGLRGRAAANSARADR